MRLRVARANVDASLPGFTETLGFPPDPVPLHEAARRSWGVWSGEDLVGVALSVRGHGVHRSLTDAGLTEDVVPPSPVSKEGDAEGGGDRDRVPYDLNVEGVAFFAEGARGIPRLVLKSIEVT